MMWFKQLLAARSMPIQQAIDILFDQAEIPQLNNLNSDQLQAVIKKKRGQLAKQFHPDHAIDDHQRREFTKKMQEINNAVDSIALAGWRMPGSGYGSFKDRNQRVYEEDMAAHARWHNPDLRYSWETEEEFIIRQYLEKKNRKNAWDADIRGSHNVGRGRIDQNYCKKEIYDFSVRFGEVTDMTFVSFDGTFFRLALTVKSNLSGVKFAAEVFEEWNSSAGYGSKAIFMMINKELVLMRLNGVDVSSKNIAFKGEENDTFYNILNDQRLTDKIRAYVRSR